jgi:hypothetical protein
MTTPTGYSGYTTAICTPCSNVTSRRRFDRSARTHYVRRGEATLNAGHSVLRHHRRRADRIVREHSRHEELGGDV